MVINPHVFAKMPFDTVRDLAPVGKIGDAVLSINDQVPSSPKDAVRLILEDKGQPVKFVIISSKEV